MGRFSALKNKLGYTLVEVMVASALGGFVLLAISSIVVKSIQMMNHTAYLTQAGQDIFNAEVLLNRTLGMASGVTLITDIGTFPDYDEDKYDSDLIANNLAISYLDGAATYDRSGIIRHFDSTIQPFPDPGVNPIDQDWISANDQTMMTIALFQRESGATATGTSTFDAVGIYFQYPSAFTPGVLYVDVNTGGGAVSPSRSSFAIGNIEAMTVQPINDATEKIKRVEFVITFRIQKNDKVGGWRWCHNLVSLPTSADCFSGLDYIKRLQKSFTIDLPNNNHTSVGTIYEKSAYFFRLRTPLNEL